MYYACWGGEPLLHPDIVRLIEQARNILPNALIQLLTNGILLEKMPEDFWRACRDHEIHICLSAYPVGVDYEQLLRHCEEHGVTAYYFVGIESIDTFDVNHLDESGGYDPDEAWAECPYCLIIRDEKLYACHQSALIGFVNQKFDTNFQICKEDYLDIHKIKSRMDIISFMRDPKPFCKYCGIAHLGKIKWRKSKQKREEWVR